MAFRLVAATLFAFSLIAAPPSVRLPDEAAGVDAIVRSLMSAFDHADIVALGEAHGRRVDADLRIALVRHPDFAKRVRSIVVEFGSTSEQATLDRYINGNNVPPAELERVWKTTAQFSFSGAPISPVYPEFLAAVRDVNAKLPADARIRVFGGDPGPRGNRRPDAAAVSVLKEQVLQKHGKALVIYGAGHFWRTGRDFRAAAGEDIGIATTPFRDFSAEEFLGHQVLSCRGGRGCVSMFQGSRVTLGQVAEACVYVGASSALNVGSPYSANRPPN